MAGTSPSTADPLLDQRGHGPEHGLVEALGRPRRAVGRQSTARRPSTKSSTDMARMYSSFIHSQLLHVEEGRGVVHVLEVEARHELLDGEDLAALGVAPAQQRQVVAHGRRPGSPRSR